MFVFESAESAAKKAAPRDLPQPDILALAGWYAGFPRAVCVRVTGACRIS